MTSAEPMIKCESFNYKTLANLKMDAMIKSKKVPQSIVEIFTKSFVSVKTEAYNFF